MSNIYTDEKQQYTEVIVQLDDRGVKAELEDLGGFTGWAVRIPLDGTRFLLAEAWVMGVWQVCLYENEDQLYPSGPTPDPQCWESILEDEAAPEVVAAWLTGIVKEVK